MFRSPKGRVPSRRVRGAEEGAVLDRQGPGGRVRARRKRRCRALRHTAERCRGAWVGRRREEASLNDVPRPAPQGDPAGHGCVTEDRGRGHPPSHLGCRRQREAPEREGEADGGGAVDAPAAHLVGDDDHHGATGEAAVTTRGDDDERGRVAGTRGAVYLALTAAVAVQSDGRADRTARGSAGGASGGARLRDGGQALLPALDVDGASDHTVAAAIPSHWNRSTTRRLSAKIRSPRRLFVAGTTPMLRPSRTRLRHRRA